MEALSKLKQITTVDDYKERFEALSNRVRGVDDHNRVSFFLEGLKDDIRLLVRMFKPQTLLIAYGLAKVQEEYVLTWKRFRNASGNFATSQYAANTMPRSGGFMNPNAAIGTPTAVVPV
jgi:hypothetical protein